MHVCVCVCVCVYVSFAVSASGHLLKAQITERCCLNLLSHCDVLYIITSHFYFFNFRHDTRMVLVLKHVS